MKFIHCSDLHLDSPMERNFTAAQARERGAELCAAFGRLADYAAENGVRAVLIAGDLFDTPWPSARTAGFVLDRIRSTPEVDFLLLPGNHDGKLFSGMEAPENLKIFGDSWETVRYGAVTVSAIAPEGDGWLTLYDELRLRPEDTNIVMLHGQEAASAGVEQIALHGLAWKSIHYLALGHIHSYRQQTLADGCVCCYSGCLEGRGFDECGEKGFVLLDAGEGRISTEFVPFAQRTVHEVDVDITGLQSEEELRAAMVRQSVGIPEGDLVKFCLTGTFTPNTRKDLRFLHRQLQGRFYAWKIADQSRLALDPQTFAHDISLKGEFVRLVLASHKTDAEKERIILMGLRALRGEEVAP